MSAHVVRDARQRAGLTQEELARRAGTSRPTVSAYESGTKSPSLATTVRLLAAAGAHLSAEPDVVFAEVPVGRGRTTAVPSHLPRLPLEQALGRVDLPSHVAWSGQPRMVDLGDRRARARAYELLLVEGTGPDIAAVVDGALLVDLWPDLVLPRAVRAAWEPLILAATGRAA